MVAGGATGAPPAASSRAPAHTATSGSSQDESDAGVPPAADSGGAPTPAEDTSCLDGVTQLANAGPFTFAARTSERLKLWVPALRAGCKTPVVHFANGTGAQCAAYQPLLERLASHGFLTVCAESTNTGTGVPGSEAFEAVLAMYPELAAHKLGSLGHHAGGQGALLTVQQAEVKWNAHGQYTAFAIAPLSGHGAQPPSGDWRAAYAAVKSPVLLMSGSADSLVSEALVGATFAALSDRLEAYWLSGVGVVHIPLPLEPMQQLAVPWLRWKLLGDAQACAHFKQLASDPRWELSGEQGAKPCR